MAPSHAAAEPAGARHSPWRIAGWVALVALLLLLAATTWVGVRGFLARGELESAVPLAATIQGQIVDGEADAARQTFDRLDGHASSAASLTSDPVWRGFELLPFAGPNLTAVRELAAVVSDISRDAVGPLIGVAGIIDVDDFKPADGAIDVQPLLDAQPEVAAANAALIVASDRVGAIDTSATLAPVRDAADELESLVAEAADGVDVLDRAIRLLPPMLGASGPRDYVLLFVNPAELRATGGIAGALALLRTENGRIELAQQASTADFPFYEEPVLELPVETRSLYGDITGQYVQDVNLTPYFPLSGALAREMWRQEFGVEAHGVLSIDPVALGYLLEATGPITLPTGDVLTAENAVQTLLVDAYARYDDPAEQDAFFAAAAASVFSAVAGGNFDPVALVSALARAGEERRVHIWSADEAEQTVLAGTTLTGDLPTSTAATTRFGAYLNDATGAKMNVYLDVQQSVGRTTCREDLRPVYRVQVTLENTAPGDAAATLSDYVTGGGLNGVVPGNINTIVSVYGAPDMENLGVTRNGADVGYQPAMDSGYPVSLVAVELAPGESAVLEFNWLGAAASESSIVIESTPTVHTIETGKLAFSC